MMEAGTEVTVEDWNVDDILDFLHTHGAQVEMDDQTGEIILYTGLCENEKGGLSVL